MVKKSYGFYLLKVRILGFFLSVVSVACSNSMKIHATGVFFAWAQTVLFHELEPKTNFTLCLKPLLPVSSIK
jgi:hypothetical protein